MKQLLFLVRIFCAWLALFFVGKLIFFAYNGFPAGGDFLQIVWHGLPLDLSVAAYTTAPIWLATWIGHFWRTPQVKNWDAGFIASTPQLYSPFFFDDLSSSTPSSIRVGDSNSMRWHCLIWTTPRAFPRVWDGVLSFWLSCSSSVLWLECRGFSGNCLILLKTRL